MRQHFTLAALNKLSLSELSALFAQEANAYQGANANMATAKSNMAKIRQVMAHKKRFPNPPRC